MGKRHAYDDGTVIDLDDDVRPSDFADAANDDQEDKGHLKDVLEAEAAEQASGSSDDRKAEQDGVGDFG